MRNRPNKTYDCCYCSVRLNTGNFSREHVQPKSKGGNNKRKANVLPCCVKCNQQKGNMTLDQYEKWLKEIQPPNWSYKVLMIIGIRYSTEFHKKY